MPTTKRLEKKQTFLSQKPINIDDFNDSEEADVNERIEKRKKKEKKRREVAGKNKLLKKRERPRKIKEKKRTCGKV